MRRGGPHVRRHRVLPGITVTTACRCRPDCRRISQRVPRRSATVRPDHSKPHHVERRRVLVGLQVEWVKVRGGASF
jgi:hypothetical protein